MRLILFFTRGVSMGTWDDGGIIERELALYRNFQRQGVEVDFVTFGGASDRSHGDRTSGMKIHCNSWGLRPRCYEALIPYFHWSVFRNADVIKTNQTNGAHLALRVARLHGKPLVARCGYMFSSFAAKQHGDTSPQSRYALDIERQVFPSAHRIIVTTQSMARDVEDRFPDTGERISVIPNYVDIDAFRPRSGVPDETDLLFVGRIEAQKNLSALLEAVASTTASFTIIGEGTLRGPLEKRFGTLDGRLRWLAPVPHRELVDWFNSARLFVLPSLYEGHPKVLIESMACGAAVLGADSDGIREVIRHEDNGWLCGTTADEISSAIGYLLGNPSLCKDLGQRARRFAVEHYSLDRIAEREVSLLRRVVSEARDSHVSQRRTASS